MKRTSMEEIEKTRKYLANLRYNRGRDISIKEV